MALIENDEIGPLNSDGLASLTYTNWQYMEAQRALSGRLEAGIFTDSHIVGESEFGPLKFINTLSGGSAHVLKQAIVVRFSCYWPTFGYTSADKTRDENYHGGDHFDEVAALISLILGIRAQAGPVTRRFDPEGDPLGTPMMIRYKPVPVLPPLYEPPRIPRLQETYNLFDLEPITKLPRLRPDAANVVVKVARMYQQALWLADAHPAMSWLLFVSTVEAAADYWWTAAQRTDRGASLPEELATIITRHCCHRSIIGPISKYIAKYTGATTKFLKFTLAFLPDVPPRRPDHENLQVKFSRTRLRKALEVIYNYRSRALHAGIAFPYPMCLPPSTNFREEKPLGLGLSTPSATWRYDETPMPMLLHVFEHIVRGTILNWVQSLLDFPEGDTDDSTLI